MDFETSKAAFLELYKKVDVESKCRFSRWVGGFCEGEIDNLEKSETEEMLDLISDELRKHVDVPGGRLKNEITMAPESEEKSVETDEFIYPDQILEAMEYSLQECQVCQSRNIENLNLVTHSMSKDDMMALFATLKKDYSVILDIGSRTGCVLFAAHLMTKCERIIGIEIEQGWVDISRKVAQKFEMEDRIEIHNENIANKKGLNLLSEADLVIMHNPFEWFSKEKGEKEFELMKSNFKKGAIIVTLPSIESQSISIEGWCENITPKEGPWRDELKEFSLYKLSQEMKNRIEKNDQQERLDYDEMKEHAKLQLQEFYNARSKLLDNLPKIEPKESMESGVQDICLTNVANYIDLHRDGNDEKRSRMRSILAEYKKEKLQADLLK